LFWTRLSGEQQLITPFSGSATVLRTHLTVLIALLAMSLRAGALTHDTPAGAELLGGTK